MGSGVEITIRELAELVRELTAFEGTIQWEPARPNGQPRRRLDTTRAREAFGFEAEVPFHAGSSRRSHRCWAPDRWAPLASGLLARHRDPVGRQDVGPEARAVVLRRDHEGGAGPARWSPSHAPHHIERRVRDHRVITRSASTSCSRAPSRDCVHVHRRPVARHPAVARRTNSGRRRTRGTWHREPHSSCGKPSFVIGERELPPDAHVIAPSEAEGHDRWRLRMGTRVTCGRRNC